MHTKLKDMICYRLDSELKTKLLDKLDIEQVTLSSFHRDVVKAVIGNRTPTATMLEPIERGS
jgi:hypothetical protein